MASRIRFTTALAVAALLIAALAISAGCRGSGATTTASGSTGTTGAGGAVGGATTTAPSIGTKKYENSDYGFSFLYAKAWEVKSDVTMEAESGGGAAYSMGVFDPKGTVVNDILRDGVVVSIYKLSITVDNSMMGDLRTEVEDMVAGLETQQAGLKTLEPLTEVEVGGLPGFKVTYSFPGDGVTLVSTLYFLFSGDLEYQISLQASETRWEELTPAFDAVIATFAVKR